MRTRSVSEILRYKHTNTQTIDILLLYYKDLYTVFMLRFIGKFTQVDELEQHIEVLPEVEMKDYGNLLE